MRYLILSLALILTLACHRQLSFQNSEKNAIASVVSAREEASNIGIEILKQGGNAFDAMAATNFALAVCLPYAGNLGGGGFMVYRMDDGSIGTLNYREMAPQSAHKDMYLDAYGEVIQDLSVKGALASGVPGTVKGVLKAHAQFGLLSRAEVMKPAINMAINGFRLTALQARRWNIKRAEFLEVNGHDIPLTEKERWEEGDSLKLPILAKTLQVISDKGEQAFYNEEIASVLVHEINEAGGIISKEDLKLYHADYQAPVISEFRGDKIIGMDLPSSGAVCLAQILHMIDTDELNTYACNSKDYIHLLVEAQRRAYADRAQWLGDKDYMTHSTEALVSKVYAKQRMQDFNGEKADNSEEIGFGQPLESNETTHFSILDQYGNAISLTTTINGAYGSKFYIDSLGFFMNNEMDDFSIKPGHPNVYGLVGSEANAVAPGKRMLSSMTPTIIETDGELQMILGTPGGSTIITSVLQTYLNVKLFNMDVQEAVDHPRFHHQWLPDYIQFETKGFDKELVLEELMEMGHEIKIRESSIIGSVNAIMINENGQIEAGADRRSDNYAAYLIPGIK